MYCLLSGVWFTADCLSEEKREGTLGLLFLTDLKGYDVVLGKLVATSLNGLYAVLAAVPILALPLLMGGVAPGEVRAHGAGRGQHALLFPRARDMRLRHEPLAAQGDGHDVLAHPSVYGRPAGVAGHGARAMAGRRRWAGRG